MLVAQEGDRHDQGDGQHLAGIFGTPARTKASSSTKPPAAATRLTAKKRAPCMATWLSSFWCRNVHTRFQTKLFVTATQNAIT